MKRRSLTLLFAFLFLQNIQAQDEPIFLENPSFEGTPQAGQMNGPLPDGWYDCGFPTETAPDVHPEKQGGPFGVMLAPMEGTSYIGMVVRSNETYERVGQRLSGPLQEGMSYEFSIGLARSNIYKSVDRMSGEPINYATPCLLRIWGGIGYCDRGELLAESELVSHPNWKTHNFTFTPSADYGYIMFEAFYKRPTPFPYNGNLLLDNASPITPTGWSRDGHVENLPQIKFEYGEELFGEEFKLTFFTYNRSLADSVADLVFNHGKILEQKLTQQINSELTELARLGGRKKYSKVSDELWSLLNYGIRFTENSESTFDITSGHMAENWADAFKLSKLPGEITIEHSQLRQGSKNIHFKCCEHFVRFGRSDMKLNFGPLLQAYAAEKMMKQFAFLHISRIRLDAGDLTILKSPPPETEGWDVEIMVGGKNGPEKKIHTLANTVVARSGYEQHHKEIEGEVYTELLNPKTGLGCTNLRMVTIAGPSAMEASAWAQTLRVKISNLAQVDLKQAGYKIYVAEK